MKINNIIVAITAALFLLTACNGDEFLDKKPLSDITDEGFFTAPNQLEAYANAKYGVFPQHEGYGFGLFENCSNVLRGESATFNECKTEIIFVGNSFFARYENSLFGFAKQIEISQENPFPIIYFSVVLITFF